MGALLGQGGIEERRIEDLEKSGAVKKLSLNPRSPIHATNLRIDLNKIKASSYQPLIFRRVTLKKTQNKIRTKRKNRHTATIMIM